jgi:penicillin-binding protein 1A
VEWDDATLSSIRRARRRRRRRHPVIAVLAIMLSAFVAVAGAGALVVAQDPRLIASCDLDSARPRVIGRTSSLHAADGSRLGAIPTTRNREPVSLARMSRWLPAATVAIEDGRFWRRRGALDYEAIARAALANVKARRVVEGGSTITQQLVRYRYLARRGVTLERKLEEACLAVELEGAWPKRRILETYLNLVFYGHGAYGAEAAAWTYFGRPARRLTLGQAALLAGLPQAPSDFDPFRRRRAARARRDEVLAATRSAGLISADQYSRAVSRPLRLRRGHRYGRLGPAVFSNHVQRQLVRRYGRWRTRHGGLRVRTTVDLRLQRLARRAIGGWLHEGSGPAGALVAIDPRTGAIRAMSAAAPGRRRLQFNLASQSRRQAGSAFKVFTLTAAIEKGIGLRSSWRAPGALTIPSRRCLNATGRWRVHNFDRKSRGRISLMRATVNSVNTVFAQVTLRVGPERVAAVARRMGIGSPLKPVCSITLGPLGVSPLEMTAAFATLAARGVRHPAQVLRRVTAPEGEVLARLKTRGKRALARRVAERVTYALSGVVRAGTGRAADIGRPAAGKTGTAEDFEDAWFCGYVPQLAACAWVGHPQAEISLRNVAGFGRVVGGSIPARIWHDFMAPAIRGKKVRPLPAPPTARLQPRALPRRDY